MLTRLLPVANSLFPEVRCGVVVHPHFGLRGGDLWKLPLQDLGNTLVVLLSRALGTHLRRDTVIPQWFQASKATATSDGHAVHF